MSKTSRRNSLKKKRTAVPSKFEHSFLGDVVPPVVRQAMPLFHQLKKEAFGGILKESISQMIGSRDLASIEASERASGLNTETFHLIYTCIGIVLRSGLRERHKAEVIEADLKAMNFPAHCTSGFLEAIQTNRKTIELAAEGNALRYPTVKQLKWRVDVTISTSALSRVLKPSVLMQMTLTDGSIKTFEMQVDQFHQLRYNVAKVLQYMRSLESRAIMSLVSDLEIGKLKHT